METLNYSFGFAIWYANHKYIILKCFVKFKQLFIYQMTIYNLTNHQLTIGQLFVVLGPYIVGFGVENK